MKQHERYSRDLKRLLNLELERNNRVRVVLTAYEELAEGEKALFRLAAEIGQDRAGQVQP
jgi:type II secretory pathway predicted ATPase ExeA